jgi:DNA invertase Pin-like site-specific DNA recombinase
LTSSAPATPCWSGSSTGSAACCALVDTVSTLADRGVGFRSLQEQVDTTTAGGKLVFHIFAALAEFERDRIRERTR